MKHYKISGEFPGDCDCEGYNIWDYLPAGADELTFPSASEAVDWAVRRSKGKDRDGIEPIWEARALNPARSASQYGLAQAVLSGRAYSGHMSKKAAQEIVDKTPERLRRQYAEELSRPLSGSLTMRLGIPPGRTFTHRRRVSSNKSVKKGPVGALLSKGVQTVGGVGGYLDQQLGKTLKRVGGKKNPYEYFDTQLAARKYARLLEAEGWTARVMQSWGGPGKWEVLVSKSNKGGYRRRNPEEQAAEMFESFHGSPSGKVNEIEVEERFHSNLAALGELVELVVAVYYSDLEAEIDFEGTNVILACNEAGTQLYVVGGVGEALDLGELGIEGEQADKDSVVVGEVVSITYRTKKDFDEFQEIDYVHEFSEEDDGPLPILRYDRLNEALYLDGGSYSIPKPMLETSPGITN